MFFIRELKSRNIDLIGFSELIAGFIFFIPILALYLERELFSITNVAIIFAIQFVMSAVFEIPTGAFADLFGRNKKRRRRDFQAFRLRQIERFLNPETLTGTRVSAWR